MRSGLGDPTSARSDRSTPHQEGGAGRGPVEPGCSYGYHVRMSGCPRVGPAQVEPDREMTRLVGTFPPKRVISQLARLRQQT